MSLLTWGSLTLWLPLQGYGVLLTFIGVLPTPPTPPTAFSMSHLPFKSSPYFETKNIEKKKSTSKCALCQEMWKCNRWNSGTAHCDRWDASALSPPPGHLGPSALRQAPGPHTVSSGLVPTLGCMTSLNPSGLFQGTNSKTHLLITVTSLCLHPNLSLFSEARYCLLTQVSTLGRLVMTIHASLFANQFMCMPGTSYSDHSEHIQSREIWSMMKSSDFTMLC